MDRGGGNLNGELPPVSSDIPVNLIIVREETKLAIHDVSEFVGVFTWRNRFAGVPHANPQSARNPLQVEVRRLIVTIDRANFNMDEIGIAKTIVVTGGNVPI